MVIIKNKGNRVNFIKVYWEYLSILHMDCKMVRIKNKEYKTITINIYNNYLDFFYHLFHKGYSFVYTNPNIQKMASGSFRDLKYP